MKLYTQKFFLLVAILFSVFTAKGQTANFTADRVSGCNPLVVSFTDKSTGTITSWTWDFGDTKSSFLPSPSTTYVTPGTYTVKLTVRNGSGPGSTKTMVITVYPSPIVSFTASPLKGCPCTDVAFTNTSSPEAPGAYTSIWSFGDGYTATTNSTTHTYCVSGKYDVALRVTNSAGCVTAKVDTAKIEIFQKPSANFSASKTEICKIPDSTFFTAMPTKGKAPYTYDWDFGDLGTSTLPNPSHKYYTGGTYSVRLIITDANGCKDTSLKVGYIKAVSMHSSFTVPSSICAGTGLVRFDNTSVPTPKLTHWLWSDGGGAYGLSAQRDFWKGLTYTITMIDSFGVGCIDTAVNTYTVHPKPKPNFSYWPIYPCPAPVNVHFTDKSNGADSITWIFGDGTTSKLRSPVHTYTHDSVFTVFMIAKTSYGCLDTFRVRDTTKDFPGGYPHPLYDSTNSPIIVRVFDEFMVIKKLQDTSCLPIKFTFRAALCTNVHLPSVVDTAKIPGCGPIRGYASPPYWYCFAIPGGGIGDPYPDGFYDPPDPKVAPDYFYPYPARTYYWDFGDGFTSTAAVPTHTYTTEGHFTVRCTITTDSCTFTDTTFAEAGTKPHADFSFTPSTICKGDYVFFTNLSTGGLRYYWDYGDSFPETDTTKHLAHKFRVSGDRRVTLTAARYGCADTISKLLIINPPGGRFVVRYSCDTPLKVTFLDSSYRDTRTNWYFGDGDTSTARNPVHIYSDTGVYHVTLVTRNDSFSCVDTTINDIYLFRSKPTFSASSVCLHDTTHITNTYPNYILSYAWRTPTPYMLDTIKQDASLKYYVIYKDTGTFPIIMYYKDIHQCIDSIVKNNYVSVAKPQMKVIASPVIACAPATIKFADSSTNTKGIKNVTRTWYWGDATSKTDTGILASKLYSTPGIYNVKVVTTDALGCKDSMTISVESSKPSANFYADVDTFSCANRVNKFFSSSIGTSLTYKWYFGDGGTATSSTPTHSYTTVGTFDVKLVVTDATGCKDSITKPAFINITKPKASFTMSDSVALCPPLFVNFTNTSTNAVRYEWDLGNGSGSFAPSPVAPYIDSGVYYVMLVAYDSHGCTDTAKSRAKVLGYDGVLKYYPLKGCAPLTVNFEAELISADVMVWDFADGYTESAVGKLKTTHTYQKAGAYIPRLILGDGKGCSTSSKGLDTIKVDDVVATVNTSPACINSAVVYNDSSYSYYSTYSSSLWTFDDASTSTDKNPTRTFKKEGTYPVTLITTNSNGCKDTIQTTVTVHGLPTIKAKDTVICLGDQAALEASGGVSYYWVPDATLSCSDCNNPITSARSKKQYIVIGTDIYGCKNKDTLDLGIKTKVTLVVVKNVEVCAHTPIQLLASGAQNYFWSPATYLSDATIPNPVATMDSSIIYRVIGTEGSCIPDTGFVKATVHPLPIVNAGPDQKVLAGTEVQLNGTGTYIKDYLWTPALTLSCETCANPTAKPTFTTTYTLKGTSEYGCSDSDDVIITIFCDQSQLYMPNTFTPNGDGQNDYFFPQGKGVGKLKSFVIFNRWGQKVFERANIDANVKEQGWDGSFNGTPLSPDTFVYTLEATCDNGEIVFIKGDVTIIK